VQLSLVLCRPGVRVYPCGTAHPCGTAYPCGTPYPGVLCTPGVLRTPVVLRTPWYCVPLRCCVPPMVSCQMGCSVRHTNEECLRTPPTASGSPPGLLAVPSPFMPVPLKPGTHLRGRGRFAKSVWEGHRAARDIPRETAGSPRACQGEGAKWGTCLRPSRKGGRGAS